MPDRVKHTVYETATTEDSQRARGPLSHSAKERHSAVQPDQPEILRRQLTVIAIDSGLDDDVRRRVS